MPSAVELLFPGLLSAETRALFIGSAQGTFETCHRVAGARLSIAVLTTNVAALLIQGTVIMKKYARGVGIAFALVNLGLANPVKSQISTPEDYLVQMVCVNTSDVAVFGDPVSCPTSRRKLRVGEALPYHKIDTGGFQISDSFPVQSQDGITKAIQTYFFMEDLNKDPLFPDQPFQYQPHGGYNVLGSDGNWVFYRGTSDPGVYWQPWWAAGCQTKGWRLFPNNSTAFTYGNNIHGLTSGANCPASIPSSNSLLEWTQYTSRDFIVSTTDSTKNRKLDTLVGYHFARDGQGAVGDLEISYFTREYGATRWEAWTRAVPSTATQQAMTERCPGVAHQDSFHGATYYMHDCRNWTTLVPPLNGQAWNPFGSAASNPDVRRWGVDPLYVATNYLKNTHQASPCTDASWQTINTPAFVQLGTVAAAPWQGGNCVRTIKTAVTPSGAFYQQIIAPPARSLPYRFGVTAWKKTPANSTASNLRIEIIQRDSWGALVGHQLINASVIDTPRWFEGDFERASTATHIIFALYPDAPNVEFAVTGAFIH